MNNEFVMVPRELIEQAMQACFDAGYGIPHDALRALLVKSAAQHQNKVTGDDVLRWMDEHAAAQHQGEPVALPSYKAKLNVSHDWDQGYSDGWIACLDELAKLNGWAGNGK